MRKNKRVWKNGLASNSGSSRLIPFSLCDRANAAVAGSCLSLRLRVWKIFAPFIFSRDVRRDSLVAATPDFCESVDIRALAGAAVDSPPIGDDVDVRGATILSLENDLLLRGRCVLARASMCLYTVQEND